MVDFVGKELFNHNGVTKSMFITYDNGVLTNDDIHYESFSLTESLCSEQRLTFGCCEASEVKFKCSNVVGSLKGQEITIDLAISSVNNNSDNASVASLISEVRDGVNTYAYYSVDFYHGVSIDNVLVKFDKMPNNPYAVIYFVIANQNYALTEERPWLGTPGNAVAYNYNVFDIYNIRVTVSEGTITDIETFNDIPHQNLRIGTFYVDSVKKINEKQFLEVTAYDAMYKILNADVTDWYDTEMVVELLPMSVKNLRDSFFSYLSQELGINITQETTTLANDSVQIIRKVIDTTDGKTVVKGSDIIVPICEINGVFGHIGRDNVFHYVSLQAGDYTLYPANNVYPADNLYPDSRFANVECDDVAYISASYEDYYTVPIDGVAVVDTKRDLVGRFYHTNPQNFYSVEDNFVVLSTNDNLSNIAQNLLLAIYKVSYRPHETKAIGNPCYEVGDAIRYQTKYATIESYMLQRSLTGIQAMRDVIIADGEEYY